MAHPKHSLYIPPNPRVSTAPASCDYTVQIVPRAKSSRQSRRTRKPAEPIVTRNVPAPWSLDHVQGLQILRLAAFKKLPWLVHGFSTRPGGVSALQEEKVLNLSFMDWDEGKNALENRLRFQAAVGAKNFALIPLKQIHSDLIHRFSAAAAQPCNGDASITDSPGLLLAAQTADCVPILLVDPKKRAVAAIHAGWRGTLARIAQKTVGRMQAEFGSKPHDLLAAIGPSIGPCCYEVGVELVTKFTAQFEDGAEYFDEPRTGDEPNPIQWLNMRPPGHQPPPKNVHLDLRKANVSQLKAAGLRPASIHISNLCTACNTNLLFSYRKEGAATGRLMSVIGIEEAVKARTKR
jgi:YfiH family protein